MNFKETSSNLGISQSKLARLSGVSRFKICTSELGDTTLTPEEQERVRGALHAEAARLRSIASGIEIEQAKSGGQAA